MSNTKKPTPTKSIVILVLLALAAVAVFLLYNVNRKAEEKQAAISLEQKQQKLQEKVNVLEKGLATQGDSGSAGQTESADIAAEADKQTADKAVAIDPCKGTADRIDAFFARLDKEDYIIAFNLEGGSKVYFTTIINKMLANKPTITRETDNLLAILQNAAHFYRVLGEKNIFILKKIMALEKGHYEEVMADFFSLIVHREQCQDTEYPIQLPMEDMYSYSTFFLNTLGGQAYLFRREPAFRTLVKYYCVLVMDLANMKNANPLGIDIRYPINGLIEELTATTGLEDKDKYLDNLLQLQGKYEKLYGN
jgi:type II secretory pathway pseudopilin PulG